MVDTPKKLGNRYEVGRLIGRGGMAEVRLGYDTRLSRTVAIKILRTDLMSDATFLARFQREAQAAAALNHPSIVAVYDTGEEDVTPDGAGQRLTLPYIVMEYVNGRTVRELLSGGKPVPIDEAVEIAVGVLSALEYSHREGIVHRDIKPGNIMLTPEGKVKVMDFGIARAVADAQSSMTATNMVVGTAQYLSPEQARGEVVDSRSDLYSAGALLFELLTGRPPFVAESALAVAYQHVSERAKPPSAYAPDVPDAIDRVVLKSLAKKREDRYQDAAAFRSDLLAATRGQGVAAPEVGSWAQPATGNATQVLGGAAVVGAGAGAGGGAAYAYPSVASAGTGNYPPYRTAEQQAVREKSNNWLWLLVLLLLAAVGGVTWAILNNNDDGGPDETTTTVAMVAVPNLEGMNQEQARAALAERNLEMTLGETVERDDIEPGIFVSSNPAPGDTVEEGSKVEVVFSSGVGETVVPSLEGRSLADAEADLAAADLELGDVRRVDQPDTPADQVISSSPTSGTPVEKGTRVNLEVASGNVPMPNLLEMSEEEATAELDRLGLRYRVDIEVTDQYAPGIIISQNFAEGTSLPLATSQVRIVVSKAPEPTTEEPTTEEPTEDPTTDPTTEQPTQDPTTEQPTEPPTQDPTEDPTATDAP